MVNISTTMGFRSLEVWIFIDYHSAGPQVVPEPGSQILGSKGALKKTGRWWENRQLRCIGTCELLDEGIYKRKLEKESAMQHMRSEEEVHVVAIEIHWIMIDILWRKHTYVQAENRWTWTVDPETSGGWNSRGKLVNSLTVLKEELKYFFLKFWESFLPFVYGFYRC